MPECRTCSTLEQLTAVYAAMVCDAVERITLGFPQTVQTLLDAGANDFTDYSESQFQQAQAGFYCLIRVITEPGFVCPTTYTYVSGDPTVLLSQTVEALCTAITALDPLYDCSWDALITSGNSFLNASPQVVRACILYALQQWLVGVGGSATVEEAIAAGCCLGLVGPSGGGGGAGGVISSPPPFVVAVLGPEITTPSVPDPLFNTAYSQAVSAAGGTLPYAWSITAGALPTGLSIHPTTGVISGTTTSTGAFAFTVTCTDASLLADNQAYTMNVAAPALPAEFGMIFESDDFDADADLTAITRWDNKQGDALRDYEQTTVSLKPWVDAVRTLNGHKTIRFIYSATNRFFNGVAATWLQSLTACELFCVMKKDNDPALGPTNGTGDAGAPFQFNRQSGFASAVNFTNGIIYEHFGNSTRPAFGNPTTSIANWCVYNLRHPGGTANLQARIDSELFYNVSHAWAQLGLTTNLIGASADGPSFYNFGGNEAAIYVADHVLTSTPRAQFANYILYKWGLTIPLT